MATNAADDAAHLAANNFVDAIMIARAQPVALYHPIKDELNPAPLERALRAAGARILLPVAIDRSAPLIFREFVEHASLAADAAGVPAPPETASALTPSIVVTPLLAFTRRGGRLGYGGGYYDRTLAALRRDHAIIAIGYAYAAQEVDDLPTAPLDQPLDWIVTETETINAG